VYALPDSVFVSATSTDADGCFSVSTKDAEHWFLEISFIGYETLTYNPQASAAGAETTEPLHFQLQPKTTMLSEVVVKSERPQLTLKDGTLTYNISNIIAHKTAITAFDVVKELPLVSSLDNNSLSLVGAPTGSTVFISGKKSQLSQSQLMDYLKSLPADMVENVEILYTPSPQWGVQTAVINVVLKHQKNYTINGQVQADYIYQYTNSGSVNGSLFLALPKFTANVMYRFADTHDKNKNVEYIKHWVNGTTYDINDTTLTKQFNLKHNVYTSFGYEINDKNSLELSYNGAFAPKSESNLFSNNTIVGNSVALNDGNSYLHDISLRYKYASMLTFGGEYLSSRTTNNQNLLATNPITSYSFQDINNVKFYFDGANSLPRNWNIMYGALFDHTSNVNQQHNNFLNQPDEVTSTNYDITEYTANVYFGLQKAFFQNKLTVRASLKGELYHYGDYNNNGLFPNATITIFPSAKHIIQAGYSSFRRYPNFWQRQEFTSYVNAYQINLGNPTLRPARYDVATLAYVFRNKYVLSATYYNVKDFFFSQAYQSPTSLTQVNQTFNLNKANTVLISLSIPANIGTVFNTNIEIAGEREQFKDSNWHDLSFNRKKWQGYIMARNTFLISSKPKITIDLTGMYKLPSLVGLWERPSMWLVNAGCGCSLLNDCLSIKFNVQDIFESIYPTEKIRIDKQYVDSNGNFYQRAFRLTIAYKFKGYVDKSKKEVDTSRYGL
jgi:hypothetical protein